MKNTRHLLTIIAVIFLVVFAAERFAALDRLGFVLLAVAGILLALNAPPLLVHPFARHETPINTPSIQERIRTIIGLIIMSVGLVILGAWALEFVPLVEVNFTPNYTTWGTYQLGVAVFFAGALLFVRFGRPPRLKRTHLVLLGIVCLALFLRVYHLSDYPYGVWYDEAINGVKAREIINTPDFRPIFIDNMTTLHLAIYGVMLKFFGTTNIDGLRLVSGLFGVGGVIAAFMVGRELRGDTFGLLMALILAGMRWSINFSRIAMTGVEVVFFTLLVFYFALKLIREGELRHSLWLGITIGLGLLFYRGFQTQLIAAIFLLLFSYPFKFYGVRRFFKQLVVGIVPMIVIALPLIFFAVYQQESYFGRVADTSVFNEESVNGSTAETRLLANTSSHLEMFNFEGDSNGRHNLSKAPMLDWVTGGFFVIGLVVTLLRGWRGDLPIVNMAFALSLVVALLNGILTVSFEAPQALRVIGALTGVTYFAAIGILAFLQTLNLALEKLLSSQQVRYAVVGAGGVVLCAGIVGLNYHTYFYEQRADMRSWLDFSLEPSLVARIYRDYDDQTQFYVSPFVASHETIQFLAPEALARSTMLNVPDILPLRLASTRPVVYMLTETEFFHVDEITRLYPEAVIRAIRPIDYGVNAQPNAVFFYVIEFSREVIASVQGLEDGAGVFYAPTYGDYRFVADEGVEITVDGEQVSVNTPIRLAQANHSLRIEPADAEIRWITPHAQNVEEMPERYLFHEPVHLNGLRQAYYPNADWEGLPTQVIGAPTVFQQIHILPMERPYSTLYTGQLYIPETGEYGFRIQTIDSAQLFIDGEMVINADVIMDDFDGTITLTEGWHDFELRHQNLTSASRVFLQWRQPERNFEPIQAEYFCPVAGLCAVPNIP